MTNNSQQSELAKVLRPLVIGLLVVALLIIVKIQVERSSSGHWFNARGYEVLHSFLTNYTPNEDPPVIVLDTSDLNPNPRDPTPNEKLSEIVNALLESGAKAIAIDINFATRPDTGARADNDPDFFEFLHAQNKKGAHVFVGVGKFGVKPEEWLGMDEDKDLAADMTIIDEDTTEVPAWLRCSENEKLFSISMALANASGTHPQPPRWLKGVLGNYDDPENLQEETQTDSIGNKVLCRRAFTLVNYAKLELVQKLSLQTLDRASILRAKDVEGNNRFQNKLVLVGPAQRDMAPDKYFVLGREQNKPVVAGIYLHALATNTLVADPVYEFKHWFTILLDAALGLFVVLGLLVVRVRYRKDRSFSAHRWENRFIWAAMAVTLSLGFMLVKFYNVLWLDFLLVILALFLHSKVQYGLAYLPQRIFSNRPKTSN